MSGTERFFFIMGPTASGKGEFAAAVARRVGGEVIACDSMKVYRGMDIGTDKRKAGASDVPLHGVDLVDVWEPWSVARWVAMARQTAAEIRARGREPIFAGGTTLYMRGLTEGIFEGPAADAAFRDEIRARAEAEGVPALHAVLREADPQAAAKIHPNDLRRITRALEVLAKMGRPISALQREWSDSPRADRTLLALRWPRDLLRRRIEERVGRMLDEGLQAEVRRLLAGPKPMGHWARQALGYRQAIAWIEGGREAAGTLTPNPSPGGRGGRQDLKDEIARATWRFARQQLTWLRRFPDLVWIDIDAATRLEPLADDVARRYFPGRT